MHWPTTLVYAVVYGGSLLCMAIGRMVVYLVGPTLDHSLWLIIVMALVALAETTLIMRPRFMGTHPIGFELELLPKELPLKVRAAHEDHSVGAFAADYGLTGTEEAIVCLIAQGRSRSSLPASWDIPKTRYGTTRGPCTARQTSIPSRAA